MVELVFWRAARWRNNYEVDMNPNFAVGLIVTLLVLGNDARGDDRVTRLIEATSLHQQLVEARDACYANEASVNVKDVFRASPQMFHGIGPEHELWALVEKTYIASAQAGCVPASLDQYLQLARQTYSKLLRSEDLNAALRFYESEAGARLISASNIFSARMTDEMYLESQRRREEAAETFDTELRSIIRGQPPRDAMPIGDLPSYRLDIEQTEQTGPNIRRTEPKGTKP